MQNIKFDRFTRSGQEAARQSAEIISVFEHNQIDTEHLLWGVLTSKSSLVAKILNRLQL